MEPSPQLFTARFLWFLPLLLPFGLTGAFDPLEALDREANVLWTTPSTDSAGSMPIGNGDIGVNVWMDPNGELLLLIAKSDAWSGNGRLLKLGRVRIQMEPNPLAESNTFSQLLNLKDGEIQISVGREEERVDLRIWVDAWHPVIHVEAEGLLARQWTVDLEMWRTARRVLVEGEDHSAYGIYKGPLPVIVEPDTVVAEQADAVTWFHRNTKSIWADTLDIQSLSHWKADNPDPLLHNTFGGTIRADGFRKTSSTRLISQSPRSGAHVTIFPYTSRTGSAEQWQQELATVVEHVETVPLAERRSAHTNWWRNFWTRHWIFVSSEADAAAARAVTRGYALQRYMQACAGRGAFPIKFNGSLFTVDATSDYDPDYRRWGGPYWWQNTRLPYFSMLHAGDMDLMDPLFDMYLQALPLASERIQTYYGHAGAYFPETMYFWGTWVNDNYGWDRADKEVGRADNSYVRWEWQGGIELCWLMLQRYLSAPDPAFLQGKLIPMATDIINLYDERFPRGSNGKLVFHPAQALETYAEGTINPAPEIAGLKVLLQGLLQLPQAHTTEAHRQLWSRLISELPELPVRNMSGKAALSPAAILGPKQNFESPELYSVFPYPLYGVGHPELELADWTYQTRVNKRPDGWGQDVIFAAMLGRTAEAKREVVRRFQNKHTGSRFPAMWGPNSDWIPDQCHGSVNMIALQKMLMQEIDQRILLFPAWPDDWDVHFRLHAKGNTWIEGRLQNGNFTFLETLPDQRYADITPYIGERPPRLHIEPSGNRGMTLSFIRVSNSSSIYTLETTLSLTHPDWMPVTQNPVATDLGDGNTRIQYSLSNTNAGFYRLVRTALAN